ncbi:hypothetical protein A6J42_07915 [Leptospira interrogans serovar Copenhageni]|nr:hypothetical protein A6J42_07915 [Leptospira interrogans serovar Copenhageni]ASP42713.1 hypothetical protein AMR47_17930 [Leptospira interrogans]KAA5551083.1 hypothetical protein F3G11_09760 [Leptospira interrogans serovar Copenhageni]QOI47858.1 hypothetical protein Lepto898_14820 [Leptospira interrogans serovar Icterohaemorrhagiae]WPM73675.1 hypothetical protein FYB70_14825 [Leptospira interrogans serovar Icterohaemorrhagiae]
MSSHVFRIIFKSPYIFKINCKIKPGFVIVATFYFYGKIRFYKIDFLHRTHVNLEAKLAVRRHNQVFDLNINLPELRQILCKT